MNSVKDNWNPKRVVFDFCYLFFERLWARPYGTFPTSALSLDSSYTLCKARRRPFAVWHALTPIFTFCKNYLVHVAVIATLTAISMLQSVRRPKRVTYYATLAVLRYVPALPSFAVYCHQALLSLGALDIPDCHLS